jgi:hypothetical protein
MRLNRSPNDLIKGGFYFVRQKKKNHDMAHSGTAPADSIWYGHFDHSGAFSGRDDWERAGQYWTDCTEGYV